jgi:hypothetical protein
MLLAPDKERWMLPTHFWQRQRRFRRPQAKVKRMYPWLSPRLRKIPLALA